MLRPDWLEHRTLDPEAHAAGLDTQGTGCSEQQKSWSNRGNETSSRRQPASPVDATAAGTAGTAAAGAEVVASAALGAG